MAVGLFGVGQVKEQVHRAVWNNERLACKRFFSGQQEGESDAHFIVPVFGESDEVWGATVTVGGEVATQAYPWGVVKALYR